MISGRQKKIKSNHPNMIYFLLSLIWIFFSNIDFRSWFHCLIGNQLSVTVKINHVGMIWFNFFLLTRNHVLGKLGPIYKFFDSYCQIFLEQREPSLSSSSSFHHMVGHTTKGLMAGFQLLHTMESCIRYNHNIIHVCKLSKFLETQQQGATELG